MTGKILKKIPGLLGNPLIEPEKNFQFDEKFPRGCRNCTTMSREEGRPKLTSYHKSLMLIASFQLVPLADALPSNRIYHRL